MFKSGNVVQLILLGAGSKLAQEILNEMICRGFVTESEIIGITQKSLTRLKTGNMIQTLSYNSDTLLQKLDTLVLRNEINAKNSINMLISARTRNGETLDYLSKAVLICEHLKQYGLKSVVFISSLAGSMVTRTQGWEYHAEKGAEQSVARWLSLQHVRQVRINVVELYHVQPDLKHESYPEVALSINDLTSCIAWLLSEAGSGMTGQILRLGTLRGKAIEPLDTFPSFSY